MSKTHENTRASARRRRASASTEAGIAAERVTLAERERERLTSRVRIAARMLAGKPASR